MRLIETGGCIGECSGGHALFSILRYERGVTRESCANKFDGYDVGMQSYWEGDDEEFERRYVSLSTL